MTKQIPPIADSKAWRGYEHRPTRGEIQITSESDIVVARQAIRQVCATLNFGLTDVTRIVTAASELTRNIYQYAGCGVMRWRALIEGAKTGLEVTFEDNGPGIPDVEQALERDFSTSRGMGLGLPGAKRLMDEMTVQSTAGKGTIVQIRKWVK